MAQIPDQDGPSEDPDHHRSGVRKSEQDSQNYEVGYRKPPTATRFAKGRSGNPSGRPPKPKKKFSLADAPSDMFIGEEVSRSVTVRENGKTYKIPALQASMRAMTVQAISGKRLAAQYIINLARAEQERQRESNEEYYKNLTILKRHGLAVIEEYKKKGLPPPRDLLPHPDDIELRPEIREGRVTGPMNLDELPYYEHTAAMRDHCLLRSACLKTIRRAQKLEVVDGWCPYIVIGHIVDDQLPMRMRWPNSYRAPSLLYDYSRLSVRECVLRVNTEWAHLKATRPKSDFVALQFARIIEESLDKIFSVVWKLPAGLGIAKPNTVRSRTAPRTNKQ